MCDVTLQGTHRDAGSARERRVAPDCVRWARRSSSAHCIHWLMLLAPIVWPATASAQNAQLSGVVRDVQGNVIVNAEARLLDEATGVGLVVRSNDRGLYVFASARPATYRLEVTAPGFATTVHDAVALHVDERIVLDVIMTVAGHQETTDVVGKVAVLAPADGSLGTVIERQFAEELPLRGRSFTGLITLATGVSLIAGRPSSGDSSEFHVNGQRNDANYLIVDGVNGPSEMDSGGFQMSSGQRLSSTVTGTVNGGLSIDAVQEVRIQTSSFAAEFGRSPGGQISLVTRSGTNRFSGSIFEQFRNDNMIANDWFANAAGRAKPSIEEHQFGATFGGPLVRGRLFFFGSYEGLRLDLPAFAIRNVPSLESRSQASPVKSVLNAYPLPTGPSRADMTAELATFYGNRRSSDTWGIRVDHSIRQGVQVFGRYGKVPSTTRDESPFAFSGLVQKRAQSVTAGLTAALAASTLIDVRGGYADSTYEIAGGTSGPGEAVRQWLPGAAPLSGVLEFGATGLTSLVTGVSSGNTQQQGNVVASLSHVFGPHMFKAGFDYRRLQPEVSAEYSVTARFASVTQALAGSTIAVLNVGRVFPLKGTFENYSFYIQDHWKMFPQLSMTYGLRWDINPAPSFPSGQGPFALTTFTPINQLAFSSQRNIPLWKTDYGNVFPRLGATYSVDNAGRTVVSAGFGRFGDLNGSAGARVATLALGTRTRLNRANVALPLTDNDVIGLETSTVSLPYADTSIFAVDPQLDTPTTTQWNLTVRRALGNQQSVSVSYVGASGENLLQYTEHSRGVNPNFLNAFSTVRADGKSRYHAFQTQLHGQLARGVQSLVSYTYSTSRDTSSTFGVSENRWAPSDFDLRHSLNGALSWELPSVKGRLAPALNDWAVHVFGGARSGYPFNIFSTAFTLQGLEIALPQRASTVPGVPTVIEDPTAPGGRRFNPSAFVNPPASEQGTTGRNEFRGFSAYQLDLALQRRVTFREGLKARIRVDVFNLFNTAVFLTTFTSVGNPNFGRPTSTVNTASGGLYRSGGPRSVAVSVRLDY